MAAELGLLTLDLLGVQPVTQTGEVADRGQQPSAQALDPLAGLGDQALRLADAGLVVVDLGGGEVTLGDQCSARWASSSSPPGRQLFEPAGAVTGGLAAGGEALAKVAQPLAGAFEELLAAFDGGRQLGLVAMAFGQLTAQLLEAFAGGGQGGFAARQVGGELGLAG